MKRLKKLERLVKAVYDPKVYTIAVMVKKGSAYELSTEEGLKLFDTRAEAKAYAEALHTDLLIERVYGRSNHCEE